MKGAISIIFSTLACIPLLVLPLASCVEIKIIAPIAENTWHIKQVVNVTWEIESLKAHSGHNITQIDLDLMRDNCDNLVANISFGVPVGISTAEWIVDKHLESGNDYFVRITSVEDPKFVLWGPRFTISRNHTKGASMNADNPSAIPDFKVNSLTALMTFITLLLI